MKRIINLVFLILFPVLLWAQSAGTTAFPFLSQTMSARVAALGGNMAGIYDNDITLAYANPSLIDRQMSNQIAFSYVNYFSGINMGMAQYAHTFSKFGNFMASIQFMDYGKFDYATVNGTRTGKFGASDYVLRLGWGRVLNPKLSIGASGSIIYSYYETYKAAGISVDVAGTYKNSSGWVISIVAANIGTQLKGYVPGRFAPLPFNLQLAVTKRLQHAPFRLMLLLNHLEKWKVSYYNTFNPPGGVDPLTGKPVSVATSTTFVDDLMRHVVFGGEILLGKNIVLRAGYNYRRRKELSVNQRKGLVGFSYGFGVKISKFQINFAHSTYHLAGAPNYFTLITSLDKFR